MNDHKTTITDLRQIVRRFVDERDWRQFHAPKNLAMALVIEAAELMEHFQWISIEASRTALQASPEKRQDVSDELADVFCYLLAMANELDIDLSDAVEAKMLKNAAKYPADEYQGRYGPEDV